MLYRGYYTWNNCDGYTYLEDISKSLHVYLEEFKIKGSTTLITNCDEISTCPGMDSNNNGEYKFILSCKDKFLCNQC